MQRLPKRSWQVYEDFISLKLPTPADPELQTDGAWIAYNTTDVAEVPTGLGDRVAGHPGILTMFPKAGGLTANTFLRSGQACKLKDWGRVGFTFKYASKVGDNNTGVTAGFFIGIVPQDEYIGFAAFRDTPQTDVQMYPAVSGPVSWQGVFLDYISPTDPELTDWFSVEIEVNYEARRIDFYVNGQHRGGLSPETVGDEGAWEQDWFPSITHRGHDGVGGSVLYVDEFAYSTKAWETQQALRSTERIRNVEDYDFYDDFLYGTTETKNAGEKRWTAESSDHNVCKSTPSAIAGHPGLLKISCFDQSGWGDGFIESGRQSFLPRDLKRYTMSYKPAAVVTTNNESADGCSIGNSGDAAPPNYNFYVSCGYDNAPNNGWRVGYFETSDHTIRTVPESVLPLPDGNTWYVVDVHFDYANRKVTVLINDLPITEFTISAQAWWDEPMHLVPVYCYTERATTADFYAIIDEIAVQFQPDETDERPTTETRPLDQRERFNTNTVRTDNA